jgi:hypothetical protein
VLWLIATIATAGLGGLSMFAVFNRMAANAERMLRDAPLLSPEQLADGTYGRIEGRATSLAPLVTAPGLAQPCLLYELVVWSSGSATSSDWGEIHREIVGGELVVEVGGRAVRIDARQVHLVTAPAHDAPTDLRPGGHPFDGRFTSRVRYVAADAIVQVVGTLTREVDADPAATNDYREIATRFRLVGTRSRPLVLAAGRATRS